MELELTKRTDPRLLTYMAIHYSKPLGFVGRNLCYVVMDSGICYGYIVGGSATRFLPGRNEYLGNNLRTLNQVINNIFFHIEKVNDKYPYRNFAQSVLARWRVRCLNDWQDRYGDMVIGFESLVELPRTGEVYKRDGWTETGLTKGFTCKRVGGFGSDKWTGKRIWNTVELRPKRVFCRRVN